MPLISSAADRATKFREKIGQRFPAAVELYREIRAVADAMRAQRNRRRCKVFIGVTGSCGKSSTTYLIGAILKSQGTTQAFVGNNMRRSVFRRLAGLSKPVDNIAQEISGHFPGHMAQVCQVLHPDIAVVTSVGHDHFASFREVVSIGDGDVPVSDRYLSAIATEKSQLVASLDAGGVACLNADDQRVRAMASRAPGRVILYGVGAEAEIRAENVAARWPSRMSFDLVIGSSRRRVETRFVGTLMLSSVLAALSVVHAVDGDLDRAIEELAGIDPLVHRMSVHPGTDGHTYILDTAKAPLWQVELLLDDLPNLNAASIVLVLGEVSDIRNDRSGHLRKLLRRASEVADHVIGFGPAASSAEKVRAMGTTNVIGLETYEATVSYLSKLPPSLVVLKSNKSVKLSRICNEIDLSFEQEA